MKAYYDLHIHTGLSPCANEDMSPNNIVNMALLNGLNVIAITDHNHCGNVKAVLEVAKETDLLVIAGMEVETSEEVHVVCLFPDLSACESIFQLICDTSLKIKNKPQIFGRQIFFNHEDEEIGEYEELLIHATGIDLYTLVHEVQLVGGVAIPAHIDRPSNSIISNLGFIPDDLPVGCLEYSKNTEPPLFFKANSRLFPRQYKSICSSDAHYLGDIAEQEYYMEFATKPTACDVIEYLKS